MQDRSDEYIGIGVGALIIKDGMLLLVRHRPERGGFWQGKWILPGGMLKVGETIDEGIVREVAEETGLGVEITGEAREPVERIVTGNGGTELHVVYIVKSARVVGGELSVGSDVGEAMWVRTEKCAEITGELHEDTALILERYGILT
ncbi:MAG: NUDIX domain-containing protein [Deltaproteobacteria bacterium]|nr:NUDIX domain-containing protein [Candidatus Zymogenaceae bacterium]